MASFDLAIPTVLEHEGGLVDHPADPGGLTNRGITWNTWRRWCAIQGLEATREGLCALSEAEARSIYHAFYWRLVYEQIRDQNVATKTFDLAVNMGHHQAHVLLQRALVACGQLVDVDGAFGPRTLDAVNRCAPAELVLELCFQATEFYHGLARAHPQMQAFLVGWLDRAKWPWNAKGDTNQEGIA